MRASRRVAFVAFGSLVAVSALVACGGGDDATAPDGGSATDSGGGSDVTVPITTPDAGSDTSTVDATQGGGDAGSDATDATVNDAADAADSADSAIPDTGPDVAPCSDASPCGSGTCCSGTCVDIAKDPANCGGCGVACNGAQFCNGVACFGLVVSNVCLNGHATLSLDDFDSDRDAASRVGTGLVQCTPGVSVRYVDQTTGNIVDPNSGQPLTGVGDTFAAAGGPYGQHAIGNLDRAGRTPVYVTDQDGGLGFATRDGGQIVWAPQGAFSATHDYFAMMVTTDPQNGTLLLATYGMFSGGTNAAGYFFQNQVMPTIIAAYDAGTDSGSPADDAGDAGGAVDAGDVDAAGNDAATDDAAADAGGITPPPFGKAWYVYEWTDATTDGPSADDTWTLLGSGP